MAVDSKEIIRLSLSMGYDLAGVTPAVVPGNDQGAIREFVAQGRHGEMTWLERHLDLRLDPGRLFTGAKNAIVLGVLYRNEEMDSLLGKARVRIARYAAGRDYHKVLAKRGKHLVKSLAVLLPDARFRVCVDSAPVAEKVLAREAGIGWRGKHTNIIHPSLGSYFFLSVILTDAEVSGTSPVPVADQCGSCRRCLDACPTQALEPYRIDAERCLSYQTIEKKRELGPSYRGRTDGWVFGCDICQEVCPFNQPQRRGLRYAMEPSFAVRGEIRTLLQKDVPPTAEEWTSIRTGSALGRVAYEKFLANWEAANPPVANR